MKPTKLNAKSPKWKSEKTCLVTKISQNDDKNYFVYSRDPRVFSILEYSASNHELRTALKEL